MHQSARSPLHLLNDIPDTSKLERGAVELELMDFSCTSSSNSCAQSNRSRLNASTWFYAAMSGPMWESSCMATRTGCARFC